MLCRKKLSSITLKALPVAMVALAVGSACGKKHPSSSSSYSYYPSSYGGGSGSGGGRDLGFTPLARSQGPDAPGYAGSEAADFYAAFNTRLTGSVNGSGHWEDDLVIGGVSHSISSPPGEESWGIELTNQDIADRAGVPNHTRWSNELDIRRHPQHEILEEMFWDTSYFIRSNGPNPVYNIRAISADETAELARIRGVVEARINALNADAPWHQPPTPQANAYQLQHNITPEQPRRQRWFQQPYPSSISESSGLRDGTLWVFRNDQHKDATGAMFDALRRKHEEEFLTALVFLATSFSPEHAEMKAGFIETFTFLYVTHKFPSEGIMLKFGHFLLRCGHLHGDLSRNYSR